LSTISRLCYDGEKLRGGLLAKSRRAYKRANRSKELDRLRKQEKKRLRRQGKLKEETEPGAEPGTESGTGEGDSSA
jgi:hypothetical protein